jgi:hypothetical protein
LTLIFGVATRPFDGFSFVCLFGGLVENKLFVVVILDDNEIESLKYLFSKEKNHRPKK